MKIDLFFIIISHLLFLCSLFYKMLPFFNRFVIIIRFFYDTIFLEKGFTLNLGGFYEI